jgi:hypothetical protein
MLTEFEGIIDCNGLSVFRQNGRHDLLGYQPTVQVNCVPFWAVVETDSALEILREMQSGNRVRALCLLEELAFSLGSQWG